MLLSPGIETKETSLQTTVTNSATGRAAMVGKFRWGPAFEISQVVSEVDLVDRFYTPDQYTADSFLSGANFLKYGNDLRLVRVVDDQVARNASALFELVTLTIANAGANYSVGDAVTVSYESTPVDGAVGKITEVSDTGAILKYFIPSNAIVTKLKELGTYPTMGAGWTVAVSTASGGTNASLTTPALLSDTRVYFPNDADARDAILAPTSGATPSFKETCERYFMPLIAARYPGEYASDIEVELVSHADYVKGNGTVTLNKYPHGGTRTVNYRALVQFGPQNENQIVVVVRRDSEVLEANVLSLKEGDQDIYGNNIWLDDYFANGNSQYITGSSVSWPKGFSGVLSFGGGLSGNETSSASMWQKGWDLFADRQYITVNLLIAGACAGETTQTACTVQKYVADLATARADCVAFISPPRSLVVNLPVSSAVDNIMDWRRGKTQNGTIVDDNMNINTTYAFIDGNYKYQYDKYNDINRWVPLAADMAGLCARTDVIAQPWYSPAGFNRGQVQGAIKLAFDTRQSHRDRLYQDGVNPVVSFAGQGILLYGDKMATSIPTPFDRINVRRLFNLLKTSIGNTSQYKLFELNDAFTQMSFRTEVSSYLDHIMSLGGMYDFRVVCDSSNNTPGVIDRNEFVATILVKPARSINYITLNFVATSTGADFDEIVGKA